ncbi:dipicolinate synthase subunit B [Natranaerovirga pectinivora]|uniref:Dipicolinate synthase subunit B n=1 Tax=Natranaerovirga pectinivora TaxID=682400 RepID=A0A4V2V0B2_9FIRM|nr:dipicolinate synthase subunit B [Natranaerovirga pectinivora]TCT15041.1 dipicolinate synthase subunit B [Natranaerovirga pectinivora]
MKVFENIKIGFVITGSFCTIPQIFEEMKRLIEMGATIFPIMSENSISMDTRFGTAEDNMNKFREITGNEIQTKINETELIGPNKPYDMLVVAPCTGNTMAKLANAITDTAALMAIKATLRNSMPVVLAISTNDGLGLNLKNLGTLMNTRGLFFVPFGQDNYRKKPRSLVADLNKLPETILEALEDRQLQPVIITYEQ